MGLELTDEQSAAARPHHDEGLVDFAFKVTADDVVGVCTGCQDTLTFDVDRDGDVERSEFHLACDHCGACVVHQTDPRPADRSYGVDPVFCVGTDAGQGCEVDADVARAAVKGD